jgi:hypothetical protein
LLRFFARMEVRAWGWGSGGGGERERACKHLPHDWR